MSTILSCNKTNQHKSFDKITLADISRKTKSSKVFNDSLEFISLIIDSNDLYGKKGIVTNFQEHGRNWEKPVKLIWYQNGTEIQNINAGLRLKGNSGRSSESLESNKAVKIHFRKEYSKKKFNYFENNKNKLPYLLEKLTLRKTWNSAEEVAYLIHKKLKASTNLSRPIGLFVNGEYFGLYSMLDAQHAKNFKSSSKNKFIYYRYRYENNNFTSIAYYKKLDKLVYSSNEDDKLLKKIYKSIPIPGFETMQKMTFDKINRIVNIESLSRQIAASIFVGNSDWNQGVLIRKFESKDTRYFWQMADLDNSFLDIKGGVKARDPIYPWDQESIELVTNGYGGIRSKIFTRLLKEDSLYSEYFIDLMFNILNHELDSSFLKRTVDYYVEVSEKYSRPNLKEFDYQINEFVQKRPNFVRKRLIEYFKKDSLYKITIQAADTIEYEINGHLIKGDFKGIYYSGQRVQIKIPKIYTAVSKLKTTKADDTTILIYEINRNDKIQIIQNLF